MMKAAKLTGFGLLVTLFIIFSYLAGSATGLLLIHPAPPPEKPAETPLALPKDEFNLLWEAWGIVEDEYYLQPVDSQKLTYGAIRGALSTLKDPNTVFMTPQERTVIEEDFTGGFEGIGAVVKMGEDGYLLIVEPLKGRPADLAGLKAGDVVLKVDDQEVKGLTLMEAITLIRGPSGTKVRLTIRRSGLPEPFEVEVARQRIEVPSVEYEMLEGEIAYVKLNDFYAPAAQQLHAALEELLPQKPRGLIFDLRDNLGGYLPVAIDVASEFLAQGVIATERGKGVEEEFTAKGGGLAADIPLVVLVNGASASASEIVAGAIQDDKRGIVIGEKTFGKGSVQISQELSDGSGLHITIAHWFTPNGRLIEGQGLNPDIEVRLTDEDVAQGLDPQLELAIDYLQR